MSFDMKVLKNHPSAVVPQYQTAGSSGFDFHAVEDLEIPAGGVALVNTGLVFEIPDGYEIQVRSRSGLALKNQVFVLNSPGTVDASYRSNVGVILANFSKIPYRVIKGARIAQGVVAKVETVSLILSESINETERGSNGFGSTGV